jgi:membrane-associated protease RseP (regulator of RpoE activity)
MTTLGYFLAALAILASVCLHEAGHMLTAKKFGMKVTRYFAGFGPTLWSFKRGETEYGIKAIPLGGFVKIVGMTPQDDDVDPEDEPRAMWRFPVWKRSIVMAAGSITHFIIGFVLIWIVFSFVGMTNPKYLDVASNPKAAVPYVEVQTCSNYDPAKSCAAGDAASPAVIAGLQTGDKIVAVNGIPTDTYGQVVTAIRSTPYPNSPTTTVTITYVRGSEAPVTKDVTLVRGERASFDDPKAKPVETWTLGVAAIPAPGTPLNVTYGPIDGVGQTFSFTGKMFSAIGTSLKQLPGKIPGLWSAIEGKPRDPNGPVSVVGATQIAGQAASVGAWNSVILLVATLNFFFGVFNLLPLLPLDGGHIAIAWYEKVRSWLARRRNRPDPGRVDYFKLMPVTYAVIVVFAAFSLLTILADVVNPINILGK